MILDLVTGMLLPVMLVQGRATRARTPRLPDAQGPTTAVIGDGAVRITLVGESTVAGVGARDHGEALAGRLGARVSEATGRGVRWEAIGRSGITVRETARELCPRIPDSDVVVVCLGVNDTLRLRPPRWFGRDLEKLFEAIRLRTAAPIVMSPVPPLGRFPGIPEPTAAVLGAWAARLQDVAVIAADRGGVRMAGEILPIDVSGLFCEDRFHPSAQGYDRWAEGLVPHVRAVVR